MPLVCFLFGGAVLLFSLLIWGGFGFGEALLQLLAVFFLFSQPLAEEVVAFPTDIHVADRIPLEAKPPRLT